MRANPISKTMAYFTDPEGNGIEDLQVTAILIERGQKKHDELHSLLDEDDDSDDDMDYGTEMIEGGDKSYQASLKPGKYLIEAKGHGINNFSKIVDIATGEIELEF